jgi:hypothetical protein
MCNSPNKIGAPNCVTKIFLLYQVEMRGRPRVRTAIIRKKASKIERARNCIDTHSSTVETAFNLRVVFILHVLEILRLYFLIDAAELCRDGERFKA